MKNQKQSAFTLIELLVVIALIAMIAALVLPGHAAAKRNAQKLNCVNNLKQVGLAFYTWEQNHGNQYPMQVAGSPLPGPGAGNYVKHAATQDPVPSYLNPAVVFMVMSNELSTPKVAYCPTDSYQPTNASAFNYGNNYVNPYFINCTTQNGFYTQPTGQGCCSYFVNADASDVDPKMIMVGDRNIGTVGTQNNAAASYSVLCNAAGALPSRTVAGFFGPGGAAFGMASGAWAWTAGDFHQNSGNIGLVDGSVQQTTVASLHQQMMNSTNVVPNQAWNFPW
jgi:prepilin-type N-terminal cleavage/methylation domain-containing protein/prepilin-type processing-associated H-X9-DG protein